MADFQSAATGVPECAQVAFEVGADEHGEAALETLTANRNTGSSVLEQNVWERNPGGEFLIGGRPLSVVVAGVGATPCYLYDRARLTKRVSGLRAQLPPNVLLHYAIKANPMPAVVCLMAGLVDGLDVASRGELRKALDAGMAPEHISFAGPGKSQQELEQSHAAGILVNVESSAKSNCWPRPVNAVAGPPASPCGSICRSS